LGGRVDAPRAGIGEDPSSAEDAGARRRAPTLVISNAYIVINHGQLGGQPKLMSPVTPDSSKKSKEDKRGEMKEKEWRDAV
jgi:hypothetical protein